MLDAARSIRLYLDRLAGPAADAIDERLAVLLKDAADGREGVDAQLLDLLGNAATESWTAEFLAKGKPPDIAAIEERSIGLAGPPEPVSAQRYACPANDCTWYRVNVGDRIPRCPTHDVPLVPG